MAESPSDLAPVRPQVYADPRPAERFDRFHEYARGHQPNGLYTFCARDLRPVLPARVQTRARPGIGLLALDSGTPVVPIAIHASERARNWRRLEFPAVTVRYGEPLRPPARRGASRQQQQQFADQVLSAVRVLHREIEASV